jgi:carbon monoxide dehydrogenase subunit G
MRWDVDVETGGPVLGLGERVLRPIAERQVEKVLAAVEREAVRA